MNGEDLVPMQPWYRGFKGIVKKVGQHEYGITGVIIKINDTETENTERLIRKWINDFSDEPRDARRDGAITVTKNDCLTCDCSCYCIGLRKGLRPCECSFDITMSRT
jgi:hypothetical protein